MTISKPEQIQVANHLTDMAANIKSTAKSHKVYGHIRKMHSGLAITTFTFDVKAGTPKARVTQLDVWLARALAVPSTRITKDLSRRDRYLLEVQNRRHQTPQLSDLTAHPKFEKAGQGAMILGVDVEDKPVILHLADMPHLFVAGNNNQEKERLINGMISTLLMSSEPGSIKLLLMNSKTSGLCVYRDSPYLFAPIISNVEKAVVWLQWLDAEIVIRTQQMTDWEEQTDVKRKKRIPFAQPIILVVINELADLMVEAGEMVSRIVERITKNGGSVGVHLIATTQCPSDSVIPGVFRDGSVARFVFQTSSRTESTIALGSDGAEKLLGVGDGFFRLAGQENIMRLYVACR